MKNLLKTVNSVMKNTPYSYEKGKGPIMLIDPGHGGVVDGEYLTAPNKMSKFDDGWEFYEGLYNRALAWYTAYYMWQEKQNYCILFQGHVDHDVHTRAEYANTYAEFCTEERDRKSVV